MNNHFFNTQSGGGNVGWHGNYYVWQIMVEYGNVWWSVVEYGRLWQITVEYGGVWWSTVEYGGVW